MLILHRLILREALLASLMSLAILLGVVSALFLAELLGEAAQGRLPGGLVFLMLLLRLPDALMMVGPLALLTGLLLALGRMHEHSEMTVMRGAGAGFWSCFAPVLVLAGLWAGGLLIVAGWVTPHALERSSELSAMAARQTVLGGLQPGQFERFDSGRLTVFVGALDADAGELVELFIHHADPERPEVVTAASGRLWIDPADGSRYLSLVDGQQIQHGLDPAATPLRDLEFARNDIRLPSLEEVELFAPEALAPLPALWPPASATERRELQWRLAPALAALVLGALAVPLAYRSPRQGRWGSLVLALTLYLIYSNAIQAGLVLMENRATLAGPGLWPLHGLLAAVTAVLCLMRARRW